MRVVFVAASTAFGGTERAILHLIQGLSSQYIDCRVITSQSFFAQMLTELGIPTHIISFENLLTATAEIRKACCTNCDIVHAHRWEGILAATTALRGMAIPLVSSVHSLFEPGTRWLRDEGKNVARLPRILSQNSSCITTVSQAVKSSLVLHGVQPDQIDVIYTGVPQPPINRQVHVSDPPTIGFIGRLSPEKGPDLLLAAGAFLRERLPDLHFNLCFVGDGSQRSELENYAHALGIADRCKFLGFLPDPYKEMSRFCMLAVPSRQEGLSLTILEAMSMRLPIVAFAVGGIPELLDHEKTGMLAPQGDVVSFATYLELLLSNTLLREQLGSEGYRRWSEHFSVTVYIQEYLRLYHIVLNSATT